MLIKKLTSQMLSYSQFLAPKEPLGDTDLDLSVSQKLHLVWPTVVVLIFIQTLRKGDVYFLYSYWMVLIVSISGNLKYMISFDAMLKSDFTEY